MKNPPKPLGPVVLTAVHALKVALRKKRAAEAAEAQAKARNAATDIEEAHRRVEAAARAYQVELEALLDALVDE